MLRKKPKWISIDIETWSGTDLKKCGLFRYVYDNGFEVMLLCFSIEGAPAKCIDLAAGQKIPQWLIDLIFDPEVEKRAWNAQFEITCLSKHFNRPLDPSQWRCTMIKAAYNGLPMSLDAAGAALKLDKQKMVEGKDLIRFFCIPCKPTKRNNQRTRNRWRDDPEKWARFKQYGCRDVDVEVLIESKLPLKLPPREQEIYALDQLINRRGFMVDLNLVHRCISLFEKYKSHLYNKAIQITGVENPGSVQQLTKWLSEEIDEYIPSLDKKNVADLLKIVPAGNARDLLEIRKELALSSVKKFNAMLNCADGSGCVRGLFQYYGASRTGRFTARQVQVHNLAKNRLFPDELAYLRGLVKDGVGFETLAWLYDSVAGSLKELIRPAIVPGAYRKLVIGDFSSIEAVVLAWLAGEKWRLDAVQQGKDIYIASASRMFHIPEAEIGKPSLTRDKGKVSELALGYQGGVQALIKMGALEMGLKESELEGIVIAWRRASPAIVAAWKAAQAAFIYALQHPGDIVACLGGKLKFKFHAGRMLMKLPSGRFLVYITPEYAEGQLTYYGQDQTTKRWCKQSIYGGKLIENAVQAIARDLLTEAMLRVEKEGYGLTTVLHVHDELVCEARIDDDGALDRLEKLMKEKPDWAAEIPVKAEVFENDFYRK